jgi:hypothetical protein
MASRRLSFAGTASQPSINTWMIEGAAALISFVVEFKADDD